ncbi:Transposase IS116/IS110/IS902 family protein [Elizabethkingia miricola]|nr:Transposase IS116/IS110/IS902 family protein [Elizabethkingia miricola]
MEKVFIGIDISKLTLDIYVKSYSSAQHYQIENNTKAIAKFFKSFNNTSNIIVAMENTGRYNFILYAVLSTMNFSLYVLNPLHLKRSIGLLRGKNDKLESQRICGFIEKYYMDLEPWKSSTLAIQKLSVLRAERRHRIKIKSGLMAQQKDKELLKDIVDKEMIKLNKAMITLIDKQIKVIEEKMMSIINASIELKDQYQRLQSIPGVGKVLATLMIIKTKGFTDIKSARKMACYSGIAPFEHQSGSSIYYKPRVSTMADMELKKILHLAAMSAIRLKNDLAVYYHRKVQEGKNKMAVLNAVRNKIIHRIYAIIKNNSVYENNLLLS